MENSKILQGNCLILNFLGWEKINTNSDKYPSGYFFNGTTFEAIVLENSDFHRNWNSLMPVVAACYRIESPIKPGWWSKADRIEHCISKYDYLLNNIEGVWTSVVEFIEWWYEEKIKSIE